MTPSDHPHFGTFGRFTETPFAEMPPAMRDAYEFTKRLRGFAPGPHKIWLANPMLVHAVVPTGAYFQTDSTLSKAEIEIATLVICSHWGAAYANYEHEMLAEHLGGLDPAKIQALLTDSPVAFDDPRQQVVYELASALSRRRVVPTGLFASARELLGEAGIVDITLLMGWYTAVSLTLMAFDVPSNADLSAIAQ
jgi:4-carboxymuconolactone decarboxylase